MQCEILPLKTVKELMEWKEPSCCLKVEKLTKRKPVKENYPRTLVCHDMKGGYLEDRWIHGAHDNKPYRFYHWYLIDLFVYFSHYLVTIPPLGWINASHRNGVPILGTFITEWDDGFNTCQEFLNSTDTIYQIAEKLTLVSKFYKFDGWLLNIENKIKPENVPKMIKFVKILTKMMHVANPLSSVIWYDSIVCSGELKWQNELNAYNRCFFDACDGFFVNYTWTDDHLKHTQKTAGDRAHDIYVGVDVFGRNCFGGGGFNTCSAVEKARDFGLSVAIFAHGWVYECLGADYFVSNEEKFWQKLVDLCNYHAISTLPLKTNFCQGLGENVFCSGSLKPSGVWHDMNLQQIQPAFSYKLPSDCTMKLYSGDAYKGRSCLNLKGTIKDKSPANFTFFFTRFEMSSDISSLLRVSYAYKDLRQLDDATRSGDIELFLVLKIRLQNGVCVIQFPERVLAKEACYDFIQTNDEVTGWRTRSFNAIPTLGIHGDFTIEEIQFHVSPFCSTEAQENPFSYLVGSFSMELLHDETRLSSFDYKVLNLQRLPECDRVKLSCYLWWESPINGDFWTVEWCSRDGSKSYCRSTSQLFLHMNDVELDVKDVEVSDGAFVIPLTLKVHFFGQDECGNSYQVIIKVPVAKQTGD